MSRRTFRWTLAALVGTLAAAGTAVAAAGSISDPADQPVEPAVRLDVPTPAVMVGDSAIAALRWVPGADNAIIGFDHTLDLESCRRLATPSCRGREGRVPPSVYAALDDHGDNYHTLIVATGYNDSINTFTTSFQQIVKRARAYGYERIVWYTLRSDVDYVSPGDVGNQATFEQINAELRRLVGTGRYPDVVIADWGGYTDDRQEWFVTDGVHYRAVGTWAAADYLSRKMAFLDGRACPMPESPGAERESPCPDPDETGPVTDIEELYPIGEDGVLCYEVGADHRLECRHDTHVLQLTRELELDMRGTDVSALQTRLVRLNYLVGTPTGEFEAGTEQAVTNFQTVQSLPPTGVADVDTLEALGFDVSGVVE